jgi:hypothetical protein
MLNEDNKFHVAKNFYQSYLLSNRTCGMSPWLTQSIDQGRQFYKPAT